MKYVKDYTSAWKIDGMLYRALDKNLPRPIPYSMVKSFIVAFVLILMLGDIPPLSLIDSMIIKNIVIPLGISVLTGKLEFDGKKPYRFIITVVYYVLRRKETFGFKPISNKRKVHNLAVTAVRSEMHGQSTNEVPDKIHRE